MVRQSRTIKAPSPSYTSGSEFDSSNSDNDGDDSGDDYSDDPDQPWCLCRKPQDGKFMVCCEACKEWYHGKCVGVTAKDVEQISNWYCPECDEKIKSGVPVSEIPERVSSPSYSSSKHKDRKNKHANKSSTKSHSSRRGPGRPRKIDSVSRSSDGSVSGNLSICLPSDQKPSSKSSSKRTSRDSSLDPKLGVKNGRVRKKIAGTVDARPEQVDEAARLRRLIRDRKKAIMDQHASMEREKRAKMNQLGIGCQPIAPKLVGSLDSLAASTAIPSEESPQKTKSGKKPIVLQITKSSLDKDASSSGDQRHSVRKLLRETLSARCKDLKDLSVESTQIKSIAKKIEEELFEYYPELTQKYRNKSRSLIFNLRDGKNEELLRRVISGQLTPERLVRMSPEELASSELAKWRERENKHSLELIKRDARLAAQQVVLKKTHKGEELIKTSAEAEEPAILDDGKTSGDETSSNTVGTSIKLSLSSKSSKGAIYKSCLSSNDSGRSTPRSKSSSRANSPPLADTTREHKSHVFDMNCKICTKAISPDAKSNPPRASQDTQQYPESQLASVISPSPKANDNMNNRLSPQDSSVPSEPKRIRVSIDDSRILLEASKITAMLPSPENYNEPPATTDDIIMNESNDCSNDYPSIANSPYWIMDANNPSVHDPEEDEGGAYDPASPLDDLSDNKSDRVPFWSGKITMPDVGELDTTIVTVSGDTDLIKGKLPASFSVCGRIRITQVTDYIQKIKSSTRNKILVGQLKGAEGPYNELFDYLWSRNRYGVVDVAQAGSVLKDFYIVPMIGQSDKADAFKPFEGPGIENEKAGANILLSIMVLSKQYS